MFSGEHPSPTHPNWNRADFPGHPQIIWGSLLRDTQQAASLLPPRLRMLGAARRSILGSGKALGSHERKGCTHSACSVSSGLSQGPRMTHSVLLGSSTRKTVSAVVFNPMGEAATRLIIGSGFSAIQNVQFPHFSETPSLREGGPFAV